MGKATRICGERNSPQVGDRTCEALLDVASVEKEHHPQGRSHMLPLTPRSQEAPERYPGTSTAEEVIADAAVAIPEAVDVAKFDARHG